MAGRASKSRPASPLHPPPPHPLTLTQGLDPPLSCNQVTFQGLLEWSVIHLLPSGNHEQLHFHHMAHLQCFHK